MLERSVLVLTLLCLEFFTSAYAHFGAVIPRKEKNKVSLELKFFHPFEGKSMNLERPREFAVFFDGKKLDLSKGLIERKKGGHSVWESSFQFKRPGDYAFVMSPKPYWEPAEDSFIIHYTKVIVNHLGLERGWDRELGIKTEIVPLTRPYGIWTGNVFQGIVKLNGKVVPNAEVEVEYYNEKGRIKAPTDSYITQVIKADERGVFTYAMPRAGWWGFAALNTADYKIKHKGRKKSVELGAVLWVRTRDM